MYSGTFLPPLTSPPSTVLESLWQPDWAHFSTLSLLILSRLWPTWYLQLTGSIRSGALDTHKHTHTRSHHLHWGRGSRALCACMHWTTDSESWVWIAIDLQLVVASVAMCNRSQRRVYCETVQLQCSSWCWFHTELPSKHPISWCCRLQFSYYWITG